MNHCIGESTLETLPGTITPPTAIYSPQKSLTDSCISISVTSTPKSLLCFSSSSSSSNSSINNNIVLDNIFSKKLIKELNSIQFNKRHVTFNDIEPIPKLSITELKKKHKVHIKLLKNRKKMWLCYKLAKCKKPTNKLKLIKLGIKINRRINSGDLI
jgi:hypothetical protein